MIRKTVFLSLVLLGLKAALLAQINPNPQLQITWQSCYGTPYSDVGGLCPAYGGGYIMLSCTQDNTSDTLPGGFGKDDIILTRFNSNFELVWRKIMGGSESDWGGFIMPDGIGNYYLSATTFSNDHDIQSTNHGTGDAWIVKIDSLGNKIWERCFGGSKYEDWCRMEMMANGNILAWTNSGSSDGDLTINYGYSDAWIFIMTPSGEIIESKVFGNAHHNAIGKVIETKDGGFLTVSTGIEGGMVSAPGHHGGFDAWALKLDKHLNIEWQKVYGGSCDDRGYNCILETDSGYLFFAYTTSNDGDVTGYIGTPCEDSEANTWMVKIDTLGNLLWQKCLGNGVTPIAFPTTRGGFVLFGQKRITGCSMYVNEDIFVKEIDSLGNTLWENTYGSIGNDGLGKVLERAPYDWLIPGAGQFYPDMPSCDMQCGSIGSQDIWLFNLKDCSLYQPLTPSQPTGPTHACSASGEPARYTVPALANQTHAWHLEPAEAGTLTTHGDTLTVFWTTTFEGTATLLARGVNDCGESGWSAPFYTEVETCAGIATHSLTGLRLWPNPATGSFNLQLPAGATFPATLALSDLSGRVVLRQPLTETRSTVDCSRLVEGVYFWRVELDYTSVSGKLIIRGER